MNIISMPSVLLFLLIHLVVSLTYAKPKAPEFVKLKGWEIERTDNDQWRIHAIAVFYNPNSIKLKLRKSSFDLYFVDDYMGNIVQMHKVRIMSESAFDIPVTLTVEKTSNVGRLLQRTFSVLSMQQFVIHIVGKLKCKVKGIPISIKIDEIQELNVKDFL